MRTRGLEFWGLSQNSAYHTNIIPILNIFMSRGSRTRNPNFLLLFQSSVHFSGISQTKFPLTFFKDFFPLFLPKAPWHIAVYFQLWVLLFVACGMLPQHGLMSGAVSVPRIRTGEILGRQSGARELNHGHGAGPSPSF